MDATQEHLVERMKELAAITRGRWVTRRWLKERSPRTNFDRLVTKAVEAGILESMEIVSSNEGKTAYRGTV